MKLLISGITTHGEFISCNIDNIVFVLFNTSSGVFMRNLFLILLFAFDVLIVVYTPRVYLMLVRVNFYFFFFVN